MKSSGERLEWALKSCEESRVRITRARSAVLAVLAEQRTPVNLEFISSAKGVGDRFDEVTVYRALMRFTRVGLVRCVGTVRKKSRFVLGIPGDAQHFLLCERCGAAVEVEIPSQVLIALKGVGHTHGFDVARECMALQGLCRSCEGRRFGAGTGDREEEQE